MVEEILPGIFRIEVPIPRSPLKALNSYLVKGPDRNLLIDVGMNRHECRDAMFSALERLSVDLDRTDFFITHMHSDHSGLISDLASAGSSIYCSRPDADVINSDSHWVGRLALAELNGFPADQLRDALERHPGYRYRPRGPVDFTIVGEGDIVSAGDYRFRCLETPGHTRGHLCLYDADRRLLVAGDHVLDDITPNISLWSADLNPLQDFLDSLDRTYALEVDLVLPGPRRLITDCRRRVREIQRHHGARAAEVLSILERGAQSAFDVASRMTWDMTYDSWEQFPVPQKWFATGEAIAHLRYLEQKGLVQRGMIDGRILFWLSA